MMPTATTRAHAPCPRSAGARRLAAVAVALTTAVASATEPRVGVETRQAERMLALLRDVAAGRAADARIDAVLSDQDTALVIGQMNLQRTVTADQYAELLRAFAAARTPRLAAPADPRGRMGVEGLRRDVEPSLRWGTRHVELLAERLEELRAASPAVEARRIASRFLPDPLPEEIRFHVVMGGRAGAAQIGSDLYFDVLASSFHADVGAHPYPSPGEIVAAFAHEAHHLGHTAVTRRLRASVRLTAAEGRAWDVLDLLSGEGSATWLISAGGDAARLRHDPDCARLLDQTGQLLEDVESALEQALNGSSAHDRSEESRRVLFGCKPHVAGAVMIAEIERRAGLAGVLEVLRDPRGLVASYNAAVLANRSPSRSFDGALAKRLTIIGR
jgi:hypothetical protein